RTSPRQSRWKNSGWSEWAGATRILSRRNGFSPVPRSSSATCATSRGYAPSCARAVPAPSASKHRRRPARVSRPAGDVRPTDAGSTMPRLDQNFRMALGRGQVFERLRDAFDADLARHQRVAVDLSFRKIMQGGGELLAGIAEHELQVQLLVDPEERLDMI